MTTEKSWASRITAAWKSAQIPAVREAAKLFETDPVAADAALSKIEKVIAERDAERDAELRVRLAAEEAEAQAAADLAARVQKVRDESRVLPEELAQRITAQLDDDVEAAEQALATVKSAMDKMQAAVESNAVPLRWLGNWQSDVEYKAGSVVEYAGATWLADTDTRENPLSGNGDWIQLSGGGGGAGAPGATGPAGPTGPQGPPGPGSGDIDGGNASTEFGGTDPVDGGGA